MSDEPQVNYTIKELLARVDVKIDNLTFTINTRFGEHEKRLVALETSTAMEDAIAVAVESVKSKQMKYTSFAVGSTSAIVGTIVTLVNYFL